MNPRVDTIRAIVVRLPRLENLSAEVHSALSHFASVLQYELVEPAELATEFRRFGARVLRIAARKANEGKSPAYGQDLEQYAEILEPDNRARKLAIACTEIQLAKTRCLRDRSGDLLPDSAVRALEKEAEQADAWARG